LEENILEVLLTHHLDFFLSWLNLIIKQINHKTMIKARLSTKGLHLIQKKFTWF
jgi:hypothetical protein